MPIRAFTLARACLFVCLSALGQTSSENLSRHQREAGEELEAGVSPFYTRNRRNGIPICSSKNHRPYRAKPSSCWVAKGTTIPNRLGFISGYFS